MKDAKVIGIVGGVGPYAGVDLVRKILDETEAGRDQEHLAVALLSYPEEIGDRTAFLLGEADVNPGYAIARVIGELARMGARVVGIPCNTAHAPRILDVVLGELEKAGSDVELIHMIEEVGRFLEANLSEARRVGLLATAGTYRAGVYEDVLGRRGIEVISPSGDIQEAVHRAVYDGEYGIKARRDSVAGVAREPLIRGIAHLRERGAEAIILGCTELPLAIVEEAVGGTPVVDSNVVLARALVRAVDPRKLRRLSWGGGCGDRCGVFG